MIWISVHLELDSINDLLNEVAKDRQLLGTRTFSCKIGSNPYAIIQSIIKEEVFRSDFETITSLMIFDDVTYDDCIESLKEILASVALPTIINDYLKHDIINK